MVELYKNFHKPHCTSVFAGRIAILNLLPGLQENALLLFRAKFYKY